MSEPKASLEPTNKTERQFLEAIEIVCKAYQTQLEPGRFLGCVINVLANTIHCITADDMEEVKSIAKQIADILPEAVQRCHGDGNHEPFTKPTLN